LVVILNPIVVILSASAVILSGAKNPCRQPSAMTHAFAWTFLIKYLKGARGIEPPPGFAGRAYGFEARGTPSAIAPAMQMPEADQVRQDTVLISKIIVI
jgi:hypothetical protein